MVELMHVEPADIERESFRILSGILQEMGKEVPAEQAPITKRVIHTTADFEYADSMFYSEGAPRAFYEALRSGAHIVTDTNMALAGINKRVLKNFGGDAHCYMAEEDVAAEAKARGCTRATVSMERAAALGVPVIFAVGNAPTALVKLYELIREGFRPAGIIGVPVGFVNVEASKELIMSTDIPCIVNRGRKGGSNVAAAICNALLYTLRDEAAKDEGRTI